MMSLKWPWKFGCRPARTLNKKCLFIEGTVNNYSIYRRNCEQVISIYRSDCEQGICIFYLIKEMTHPPYNLFSCLTKRNLFPQCCSNCSTARKRTIISLKLFQLQNNNHLKGTNTPMSKPGACVIYRLNTFSVAIHQYKQVPP